MNKIVKILTVFTASVLGLAYMNKTLVAAPSTTMCSLQYIDPKQRKIDWNDYVWKSVQEHDNVKADRQPGLAAVCGKGHGTNDYCTDGQKIEMPSGHVYHGNPVNRKVTYVCITSGDDRWEEYVPEVPKCSTIVQSAGPVVLSANEEFNMDLTNEMCADALRRANGDATAVDRIRQMDNQGSTFRLFCDANAHLQCRLKACAGNYTVSGNRCVQGGGSSKCDILLDGRSIVLNSGQEHNENIDAHQCRRARSSLSANTNVAGGGAYDDNAVYHLYCTPPQVCKKVGCKSGYRDQNGTCVKGGGGGKTCREQRAGMSVEAIACCDTGSAATWDSPIRGKCNCKDSNTHFEIVNGRGQCVANGSNQCPPDARPSADNTTCICNDPTKTFDINTRQCVSMAVNCPQHMAVNPSTNQCECVEQYQRKEGNTCVCTVPNATNDANGVCKCNEKDYVVKDGQCVYDESILIRIRGEIIATFNQLNSHIGGLEQSVWKDAEGNFNTARLASDSIAGVVLGTAGGLITAKVVKKNQLKQGFEDIKCSIGGQTVASYGDDFTVGM